MARAPVSEVATERRRGFLLPSFVLLLAVLAICWRIWTPIPGARRAFSWDAQWGYWGDLTFQIDAWKHGHAPLWDPYDRCGYPFAADPQPGILYPINWALVLLGMVAGAKFWLVSVKIVFHVWWWALGTYVWLRRRGTPAAACAAAGVFCIVAFPAKLFPLALNWTMAWSPWVLLAVDRFAELPSRRTAAWLAIALAMCLLAGSPPSFWYALLIALPYAAWAVAHQGKAAGGRLYRRQVASAAGLAAALFLVMAGGQMLATAALVPHTVRAERGLGFLADFGLGPEDLVSIFVPRMPGANLYVGMVAVLAAVIGLTVRPSGRGYVLAGIALGGGLLALGSGAPFLASLASVVPAAGLFRISNRYTFLMIPTVAALGAEGLALLATLENADLRRSIGRALAVVGALAGIVFGVAFLTSAKGALHDAAAYGLLSSLLSVWVLRQLVATDGEWRPRFITLAALVLALDLWHAHAGDIELGWWPPPATPHDSEAQSLPDVPAGARIFDREYLKFRAGTRLHLREFGGYEGDPLALRRYVTLLDLAHQHPSTLGHANVAYIIGSKGKRPMALTPDFQSIQPEVFRVPTIAPAIAWYPSARVVADETSATAALQVTTPGSAPLLEEPTLTPAEKAALGRLGGAAQSTAGRFVEYEPARIVAEVDAPADGVVVVAEAYHPGWSVTVDGRPAHLLPANGLLRGVLVGAGHHRLDMRFHLGLAGWLMLLSPLGLAVALGLAAGGRIPTRRS